MKITTNAKIKKCTMKPECADIFFDELQFTGNQYKEVSALLKENELVTLTIEPAQQGLGFTEGDEEEKA